MVKNLPAVERSTKIRFGKNVPEAEAQAENTIVFNASNSQFSAPTSNAVYLSPIRLREDYDDPAIVLLMYNKLTKEITESGEAATDIIQPSLQSATGFGNITSNVVTFTGAAPNASGVSFVTSNIVGLSNLFPEHTVSVGSNLYVDDSGRDVLVVSGNVSILGNLQVTGDTTVINTENTSIKDAIVELGKDNTSGDTTLDLGILMHRPDALSNVIVGYREETDEFAIAYTDSKPIDKTLVPKTDEDINVHVYGLTHVDANIYAHEDILVDGNVYVSGNASVTKELTVSGNVYADKDLEVIGNTYVDGNVVAYKDLTLSGNAYVSGNVNITNQLSVTDNVYVSGNVEVANALIVSGNTHLEGDNVFITNTMDFLDPTTAIVTDQISNVQIRLGQLENVSNLVSNPRTNQILKYINNEWSNDYPQQNFTRVKNGYSIAEGRTLYKGNTVYVSATQNAGLVQVRAAQSHIASQMPCFGLVYEDIGPENEGIVLTYGILNNVNTTHLTAGGTVYVSNVYSGYHTAIKPDDDVTASPDLIQNLGICTRSHQSSGAIFVTGIGRANDIPNAELITDYNEMNYVYVNNTNNDLKKITSAKLNIPLTTAVSSSSNSAANAVTLRGVSITSGDGFHGDLVVAGNVTIDSTTLHVDADNNRVGLGTVQPGQLLDVRGAANVGTFTTTTGTVTDTTHSTSKDTGVLVLTRGGLGVEANIHSTNVFVASHIAIGTSATSNTFDVRGTANVGALVATSTHISDSTTSTTTTSGALQVRGGVSTQDKLNVGGITKVWDTTDATGSTDGALIVSGGVDIAKKAFIAGVTSVTNTTDATGSTDGALVVSGGVGVAKKAFIAGVTSVTNTTDATGSTDGALIVSGGMGVAKKAFIAGVTSVTNTTDATNKTSGALQVTGGVGIQGDLYATDGHFSSDVSVGSLTNKFIPYANASKILTDSKISQETNGTVVISNDVQISGNLLVQGESFEVSAGELIIQDRIIDIANNNSEHDLDIGILMEHPGHNIGIIHHDTDELTIGYTQNGYSDSHILRDYSNHITMNVWGHVITQNTVTVEYNDVYIVGGGLGIGIGDRGDKKPDANIHVVGNVHVTSNISTVSNVLITGDAAATSKTTGALQVTGGISTQANLYVGKDTYVTSNLNVDTTTLHVDSVANRVGIGKTDPTVPLDVSGATTISGVTSVTNDTDATGSTDGALIVSGGMGVAKKAFIAGVTSVTNTTDATGSTDGALVVSGGVGVAKKAFIAGVTSVTNATDATGSTDGALIVSGGMGVAKKAFIAGVTSVTNATEADSTTTGALQVTGGISTQANLYVGKDTYVTSNLNVDSTTLHVDSVSNRVGIGKTDPTVPLDVSGATTISGVTSVTNDTDATGSTDGALVVSGGVGVAKKAFIAGVTSVTNDTDATGSTDGALVVSGGVGVAKKAFIAGVTSVTNDTDATGSTDGALVVSGGVGVAKKAFIAGVTSVTNATDATGSTDGALVVSGGMGVAKKAFIAGVTSVTNATDATGSTDGALVVSGGMGVAKKAFIAGVTSVTNATDATGSTDGALVVSGGMGVAKKAFIAGVTSVTNATDATGSTDGALVVSGGMGVAKKAFIAGVTSVTNATDATGSTDGALVVSGGMGVAKKAFIAGVTSVTDSTEADSTTTGALQVTGGISTQANLYVGKDTYITSNLNVDTTTLHVDSVANRVGIGKTDPGFALDVVGDINFSGSLYEGGSLFVSSPWTIEENPDALSYTAGNVGVGAANPDSKLYVTGNIYATSNITTTSNVLITGEAEATSKTTGALQVTGGVGIGGDIHATHANLEDVEADSVTVTDTTQATDTLTGALTVAGGISTQTNVHAANVYISGGLITNTAGVTKKTYSYSGDLDSAQTIANSTIKLTFTNHTFSAKVVAHLIESDNEVSTLSFECCGGNWSGSAPANDIALGPVSVFGPTSTNPWDSAMTTTGTTVSFKPTTDMAAAGHYNVFVEYFSQHSAGELTSLHEGATTEVSDFGY